MAMQTPPPSTDPTLDNLGRAPFGLMDILRRAQGDAVGAFGLDPSECAYRVIASGSYWRLRDYGMDESSAALLVDRGADQATVHLGSQSVRECDPLLPGARAPRLPARMVAGFARDGKQWAGRVRTSHCRVCRKNFKFGAARQTIPDRSFTRGHARGDIRCCGFGQAQGSCAPGRATLLRAADERFPRRSRVSCSAEPVAKQSHFQGRCCRT